MAHEKETAWRGLLLAAVAGDEASYRSFLGDVAGYLRGWAQGSLKRAGRSPAEAEDIVQETLIAIHTKRHTWDASQPVGPWLHGIARHKLIDALRKRTGHDHLSVDDFAEVIPALPTQQELAGSDITRMIASLPSRQARIVEAIFVDGQRTGDVAGALDMSEGAVRVALHRALKSLARTFGRDSDNGSGPDANR
ncbi:MAG: sigma-70 family RNA polymerase sigma factor [Hyphomicrobiales bacterium]|nr:sigma-70 family RNA polymerase sigma factor [Hyphomicrobiales bacterium]